jgi:protein TonB
MDISLSASMAAIMFAILVLLTIGIIVFLRGYFRRNASQDLTEKYKDSEWSSPLEARHKYPDVDEFGFGRQLFSYGLATALAFILFAFSWTSYDSAIEIPEDAWNLEEEIEVEPPRTAEPPPPPPPPPPPVIEEVPEEEILEEDEPEFVNQEVFEETVIDEPPPVVEEAPPPPPPPPPPEPEVEEIFKVVEQMPRFPGCESVAGSNKEKDNCARDKLLQFIYKNLKYPAIARENGVEGQVVVQFVVEKDGSITDVNVVRDIGAGCGDSASKVVNSMNSMPQKWTPGKQRGRSVRVQFTLPVRFKLEG